MRILLLICTRAFRITTIICTTTTLCFRSSTEARVPIWAFGRDSGLFWCPIRSLFWEYFGFAPYTGDNIVYKIKVRAWGDL